MFGLPIKKTKSNCFHCDEPLKHSFYSGGVITESQKNIGHSEKKCIWDAYVYMSMETKQAEKRLKRLITEPHERD